jgi:hypothetical protein
MMETLREGFLFVNLWKGERLERSFGMSVERSGFVCSDCLTVQCNGAAAFTGAKKQFTGGITEVVLHVIFQHCYIQRRFVSKRTTSKFARSTARYCECSELYQGEGVKPKVCVRKCVLVTVNTYDRLK